jgi:DNA replication protein DnaC
MKQDDIQHTIKKIEEKKNSEKSKIQPHYDCPCKDPSVCQLGGYILQDDGTVRRCEKYFKWKKNQKIIKKLQITLPKQFWNKKFPNFETYNESLKKALEKSKKYATKKLWNKGINLFFLGGYGRGKTHLAAAITRHAIVSNESVVFITGPQLGGEFKEVREKFNKLKDVDLLIIDDLAGELENSFLSQEFFNLVNYRYEANKGIVLTSNLNKRVLENETIGPRVWDRLQEKSVFIEIKTPESYRKKKRDLLDI